MCELIHGFFTEEKIARLLKSLTCRFIEEIPTVRSSIVFREIFAKPVCQVFDIYQGLFLVPKDIKGLFWGKSRLNQTYFNDRCI